MSVQKKTLSAQVILNTATGLSPTSSEITAENIDKYLPPKENIVHAKNAFKKMGFEVGEFVGTSFSITAAPDIFVEKFNMKIPKKEKRDQIKSIGGTHLPVAKLPKDLADVVHDIVFPEQPDFGPGNF